jgi:hypothetical protein
LTWCSDVQSYPPTKQLRRLLAEYAESEHERKILMYLSSAQGQSSFCDLRTGPYVTLLQLLSAFPSSRPPLDHLLSVLNTLMPRLAQWTTAFAFAFAMRYATGVTFSISPADRLLLDSKRPVIIIGNHQTELDVLLLGYMFPKYTSVTAKKSLKNVPVLGWFMSLSSTVFIDRVDRSHAIHLYGDDTSVLSCRCMK